MRPSDCTTPVKTLSAMIFLPAFRTILALFGMLPAPRIIRIRALEWNLALQASPDQPHEACRRTPIQGFQVAIPQACAGGLIVPRISHSLPDGFIQCREIFHRC